MKWFERADRSVFEHIYLQDRTTDRYVHKKRTDEHR